MKLRHTGFTLVEMIMVIVITGIIGGMVAVFLKAPVQQYMDVARRADMTDIADTALRRLGRDLRLALPNSVRVNTSVVGGVTVYYLDFLATSGGGRYRIGAGGSGDILDFSLADSSFEVLGTPPSCVAGDQVVVYNMGMSGLDAYAGDNRTACDSVAGQIVKITTPFQFRSSSPNARFQIVHEQVRYICNPGTQSLTRYSWGGGSIVPPAAVIPPVTGALLATHVSACSVIYDPIVVAQHAGLVTLNLSITEDDETVTVYNAVHVSNVP
ncbi:MAG: prepilin-type N-terminal cleavage/methylation domain-containing protein [Gallionella sp.]